MVTLHERQAHMERYLEKRTKFISALDEILCKISESRIPGNRDTFMRAMQTARSQAIYKESDFDCSRSQFLSSVYVFYWLAISCVELSNDNEFTTKATTLIHTHAPAVWNARVGGTENDPTIEPET